MEFKTKYDKHDRVFTNPGSPIKDILEPTLDKYGNRVIEKKGEKNLYQEIQSWRDECDINILMAKFTNGDKTALMQRVGAYLDLSEVPENFNDMMNLTTRASALFDSLPTNVKEMFGNNVTNFLANSKTKEFAEIMSKSPEDYRKEKIMKSHANTEAAREARYIDLTQQNVKDDSVSLDDPVGDIVQEVKNTVYGKVKLNESK